MSTEAPSARASRRSIYIPGFSHANPIPNACRLNGLVMSGVVVGFRPGTNELPDDLESQCRNMFAHADAIIREAGGTSDHIVKMTVWMREPGDRSVLNLVWLETFPDATRRPARHVMTIGPESPALIQCDFTAFISEK